MKKFKIIFSIALIIIVFIIAILIVSKAPSKQNIDVISSSIQYNSKNNENVISNINIQLKDIDIEKVLKKSEFILEKTIPELQQNIHSKKITYEDLTAFYLYRIKIYDQSEKGFNSVITVNKNAIALARNCDNNMKPDNNLLYGIPIALKDNINTADMTTTAGSVALKDFIPSNDAPIVNLLKEQGAIILAKTNLSEFANFKGYSMPSGYNDLKGQNMNPYDPENLTTWGSSSGSATFATCNFASATIGTETTGSIVAPASIQGVVGFRPSLGKVSKEGIIPLSHSLDTAGPITRTVLDSAILYNTISSDSIDINNLETNDLKGKNIGIPNLYKDSKKGKVLIEKIKATGANIIYIDIDESKLNNIGILLNEFRDDLNNYLTTYNAPVKTLEEIVNFYKKDPENRAKYGMEFLELAQETNDLSKDDITKQMIYANELAIKTFSKDELNGIAFINNDYSLFACMSGCPEITVPLYIEGKEPIGATFISLPGNDFKALNLAYSFEQNISARKAPLLD